MNKNNHINIGKLGENIACAYLSKNGYKLVERNVNMKWGEIDIIAINTEKILTFIEVKTIKIKTFADVDNSAKLCISPENNLTKSKFIKLQKCAQYYANNHPNFIYKDKGYEIDLIAILINEKENYKVNYYENIFI